MTTRRFYLADLKRHGREFHNLTCTRAWAEARGIDWRDFCRNGIDRDDLIARAGPGDPEVNRFLSFFELLEKAGQGEQR